MNQKTSTELALEPEWFDSLSGLTYKSADCAAEQLDLMAWYVKARPDWILESGIKGKIILDLKVHRPRHQLVFVATMVNQSCVFKVQPDPSGWLRVTVSGELGDAARRSLFECWINQPYEEYQFWPAVHRDRTRGVAMYFDKPVPGRMGKRMSWIAIEAGAWSQDSGLHCLCNDEGYVLLRQDDGIQSGQ